MVLHRRWYPAVVLCSLLLLGTGSGIAGPISTEEIPETLRAWVPWILHAAPTARCPQLSDGSSVPHCRWGGPLQLTVSTTEGHFIQTWTLYGETAIPLPGDRQRWPMEVTANGQAVAVVAQDERPVIWLRAGTYTLAGQWHWTTTPESLAVATEIGLLRLTVDGHPVAAPVRDHEGRVWIRAAQGAASAENHLALQVFRNLLDEVPTWLTTVWQFAISGADREITIAHPLPEGFLPLSLDSTLPARIEANGALRLQLRPGEWTVTLMARSTGPVTTIQPPDIAGALGAGATMEPEIWVFAAQPTIRLAALEGATTIDPQQTNLPSGWKHLPAYRIEPGSPLALVERQRGGALSSPEALHLQRTMWLDFNGRGYTLRDRVDGTMRTTTRLEVAPPLALGHVEIGGEAQLITRLPQGQGDGVEVRAHQLHMTAESRVDTATRRLPTTGWQNDFQSVQTQLHLPPGWRLFATTGVDEAPQTWTRRWSLMDLFLLLLIAATFYRLWGVRWGAIAFAMALLTLTERGAPYWTWLFILAGVGLTTALPTAGIGRIVRGIHWGVIVILLGITLNFAVSHLRAALFPVLEHPGAYLDGTSQQNDDARYDRPAGAPPPVEPSPVQVAEDAMPAHEAVNAPSTSTGALYRGSKSEENVEQDYADQKQLTGQEIQDAIQQLSKPGKYSKKQALAYRPGTKIQTGHGIPGWEWRAVSLGWSGPVDPDQRYRLWLIPPWGNRLLAVARVLLLGLMLLRLWQLPIGQWVRRWSRRGGVAGALALMVFLISGPSPAVAAEAAPSPELLDELRDRLLAAPTCGTQCASIGRMILDVSPDLVRARLEVHAAARTAIPLPGNREQWTPDLVTLDGTSGPPLRRDDRGLLWVAVEPGVHQVILEGSTQQRSTIALALPLKPHQVEVHTAGWGVSGVHPDGKIDEALQLNRIETAPAGAGASTAAGTTHSLPPLLEVTRRLTFGLEWEVETTIRRVGPTGTVVNASIPLLPGESVTTDNLTIRENHAQVTLSPTTSEVYWRAGLTPQDQLELRAAETTQWIEVWEISASPIWHLEQNGIPPVTLDDGASELHARFRPWPGERVALQISRPEGVPGPIVTIDRSRLAITPGAHATDVELQLELRSSLGGQHTLRLPEGSRIQSVMLQGAPQPILADHGGLHLTLTPGRQQATIRWQEPRGIAWRYRTSAIDVGTASVNADMTVAMSRGRWTLWVCGPRVGPAVLFWSFVLVLLVVAVLLGRWQLAPLRTHDWFLLGIGLSQVSVWTTLFVAGWFLVLGWRSRQTTLSASVHNVLQIGMAWWSLLALVILAVTIHQGLLGSPESQIAGNGSSMTSLHWFQDRTTDGAMPQASVYSVSLFYYRLAMLGWALWLAAKLLTWVRWAWASCTTGGLWKR